MTGARMGIGVAVVAAVTLTFSAATAGAYSYASERPAGPRVLELRDIALRYWATHGVTGCTTGVQMMIAPNLDGVDGRGGDCQAWVSSSSRDAFTVRNLRVRRVWARYWCAVVVHEVGHALGLPHAPGGVMDPVLLRAPSECSAWAAGLREHHWGSARWWGPR